MRRVTPESRRLDILHHYDQLGPLTRATIMESPIEMVVSWMLDDAPLDCTSDSGWGWDDRRLSAWLRRRIQSKYGQPPEAYVLRPRRVMTGHRMR